MKRSFLICNPSHITCAVLDTSPAGPGPELPSLARVLFAAAARRDSSRGLTKAKHLPLPKLRKADGKLFSEDHTQIPEVIRPSGAVACCIAALSELCLGSVLLPVHANNAAALEELYSRGSMVWDSNSELGYSYCVPIPPSTASYAGELACDFSILSKNASSLAEAMRGRIPVQLCLGDEALDAAHTPAPNYKSMSPHSAPIVVVRPARGTWENSFLAALACLDLRGLVTARFTLAGPRQGDEAGPSSAHAAHGVRAEVHLTAAALRDLFFDEDTSHFEEHFDEAAQKRKNSKGPGNPRRIRGDGELLCTLLSALLLHGSGLSLGPDSDGLLNYNDPGMVDERAAIMASPPAEVRGQFDVSRVLESVARKDEAQAAKAQAPGVLLTRPKQYQLAGLQWMLDREEYGDALGRGQALLHPAWVQLVTPSGQLLYLHRATPHVLSFNFYSAPPPGTCGGCIADEVSFAWAICKYCKKITIAFFVSIMLVAFGPLTIGAMLRCLHAADGAGQVFADAHAHLQPPATRQLGGDRPGGI